MLLSKSLLAGFVTLLTCWYFISPYLVTPSPKFPLHMWAFLIIFISFKLNSRHCIIVTVVAVAPLFLYEQIEFIFISFYFRNKLIEEEEYQWSSTENKDILENWTKWRLYLLQDSGETVVVQPDMQISISNLVKIKWVSFHSLSLGLKWEYFYTKCRIFFILLH